MIEPMEEILFRLYRHTLTPSDIAKIYAEIERLRSEIEEIMRLDYYSDRMKIEKTRADTCFATLEAITGAISFEAAQAIAAEALADK